MVINMVVSVYSTEVCPKCKRLKEFLTSQGIDFSAKSMESAEGMAELFAAGVFEFNAPVLQINENYLNSKQLFNGTELNKELILNSIKVV